MTRFPFEPMLSIPALLLAAAVVAEPLPMRPELHPTPESVRPLLPGMQAPAFSLHTTDGRTLTYAPGEYGKPVILTFYRGGWCPYCNLHLAELRTVENELQALGFEVWFISPDRPELLEEGDSAGFGYTLLSDPDLEAARGFGIGFTLDQATLERYREFGVDLADRSGETHGALPVPATYLVGADGTIQFSFVNPDYTVRLAPEVLLAAARAYREDAQARLRRAR